MPVPSRILIYGLLNPVEVELFYVGQTRKRREFRLLEHISVSLRNVRDCPIPPFSDDRNPKKSRFRGSEEA